MCYNMCGQDRARLLRVAQRTERACCFTKSGVVAEIPDRTRFALFEKWHAHLLVKQHTSMQPTHAVYMPMRDDPCVVI